MPLSFLERSKFQSCQSSLGCKLKKYNYLLDFMTTQITYAVLVTLILLLCKPTLTPSTIFTSRLYTYMTLKKISLKCKLSKQINLCACSNFLLLFQKQQTVAKLGFIFRVVQRGRSTSKNV